MFGLKTFVQVQTFRRGPPLSPYNFCHPASYNTSLYLHEVFNILPENPIFALEFQVFLLHLIDKKGYSVEEKKVVKYRCGFGFKDLFCILSYLLSKEQPKLAIKSIFANYKLGLCLDFCCKLFYQTAKRTTNAADSVFMQINYLVFDPEVFANLQIAS